MAVLPGTRAGSGESSLTAAGTRVWRDGGYWLLPALAMLVLLAFRRGAALLLLGVCLLLPPGVHAGGPVAGTPWRRPDQVEHARMREGLEAYRAGNHAEAERTWRELPGADAAYNRGNALARDGRLREALDAYDEALRRQPGMEDAVANRAVVEAALRRQLPQGPGAPRQQAGADDERDGEDQPGDAQAAPEQAGQASREQPPAQGQPEPGDDGEPAQEDSPPPPEDAGDQDAADAAQRERIEQALENAARAGGGDQTEQADGDTPQERESDAEREQREAAEAWLRRVPDDPGGLLRARFRLEHERRNGGGGKR